MQKTARIRQIARSLYRRSVDAALSARSLGYSSSGNSLPEQRVVWPMSLLLCRRHRYQHSSNVHDLFITWLQSSLLPEAWNVVVVTPKEFFYA